jgi:glucosamine--fructose-6-phosphate aminotransferase (isomerizing)
MEGLRRLEYRGYDSAGIALVTDAGELFVEKRAGKLANLAAALEDRTPRAGIGLAHTRWATHGRPNDLNAHPHVDCTGEITVIHNGIIENFRELRDGLEARGHALASETDTEALAHLVEEAYHGDLAAAVREALARAQGAYAIAVMHRGEPDRLVGARMNVPLVVGIGDGETFLASDVAAILAHTNRVVFLEEGDVADLRPSGIEVTDVAGVPHERVATEITWTAEAAEKGGFEHFMLKEIHEQPQALRQCIAGRLAPDGTLRVEELAPLADVLRTITRVELIACGTASYAALVGAALIERWTGLAARVTVGSEFRYSPPPLDPTTLVLAVTQSGETADTIAPTRHAREQGCPIVAVTNTVGSAITREADAVLFLQAGPEIAVAASKTFTTQVATLVMVAAAIARIRGTLPPAEERALVQALRHLPDAAQRALDASAGVPDLARRYVHSRGFMFVGRGTSYPAALEGALKLKEVSYIHAEGYAAGELKHGPISLLDAECPLVAVATRSAVYDKLISNVMEGRARDARVIAVATEGDVQIERFADDVLWVPDTLDALSPILAIIPLQLFAYHMAVARGTDVDQPRNLAKSVTVE